MASSALHSWQYMCRYFDLAGSYLLLPTWKVSVMVDSQYGHMGGLFLLVSNLSSNGIGLSSALIIGGLGGLREGFVGDVPD